MRSSLLKFLLFTKISFLYSFIISDLNYLLLGMSVIYVFWDYSCSRSSSTKIYKSSEDFYATFYLSAYLGLRLFALFWCCDIILFRIYEYKFWRFCLCWLKKSFIWCFIYWDYFDGDYLKPLECELLCLLF